jgi:hypothetical protein
VVAPIRHRCEAQDYDGRRCNRKTIAAWRWPGGPGLRTCKVHDRELRQKVKGCRDCRKRLRRAAVR